MIQIDHVWKNDGTLGHQVVDLCGFLLTMTDMGNSTVNYLYMMVMMGPEPIPPLFFRQKVFFA